MPTERNKLIRALMEAQAAFHNKLNECGYRIECGLGESLTTGNYAIFDNNEPDYKSFPVGKLTLKWRIEK